jgi:hypothetical protein
MNPSYEELGARVKELEEAVKLGFNSLPKNHVVRANLQNALQSDSYLQHDFIHHKGLTFYPTGKWGNRMVDSMMCKEFKCVHDGLDSRLWLHRDGTVVED